MNYLDKSQEITRLVERNFLKIFDDKFGIICEIFESIDVLSLPLYNHYAAAKLENSVLCSGAAIASDRDTSLSKAIGECLERYCLSSIKTQAFIETSCNCTKNRYDCISPKSVEIYTKEELEKLSFYNYNESFKTLFCIGYNVTKKTTQYVPVSMVYLRNSYFENCSHQLDIIQQTISTGAAFGFNFYQAALSGVYEVIERDAMMAFWLLGKEAPRIEIETLAPKQLSLVNHLRANEVEVYLFDISLNREEFVILSSLRSKIPGMPAVVFSAAAHHDIDVAIQKALEEVVSTFCMAENLLSSEIDSSKFSRFLDQSHWSVEVFDRNDHVKFWAYREIFDRFGYHLDFIFRTKKFVSRSDLMKNSKQFADNRAAFNFAVESMKNRGDSVILVDISTSDIRSLGFLTLKAIIPGHLPLHLGHRFAYSHPKRLFKIAYDLYGLRPSEICLNLTPHPFP